MRNSFGSCFCRSVAKMPSKCPNRSWQEPSSDNNSSTFSNRACKASSARQCEHSASLHHASLFNFAVLPELHAVRVHGRKPGGTGAHHGQAVLQLLEESSQALHPPGALHDRQLQAALDPRRISRHHLFNGMRTGHHDFVKPENPVIAHLAPILSRDPGGWVSPSTFGIA